MPALVEEHFALGDDVAAHPACQHGLAFDVAKGLQLLGRAGASVMACGVRMTSKPSLFGSRPAISSVLA
jgi:hypothetical protein